MGIGSALNDLYNAEYIHFWGAYLQVSDKMFLISRTFFFPFHIHHPSIHKI